VRITVDCRIEPTPRVLQVRGAFDLPEEKVSRLTWDIALPLAERPWNIGLIAGPSGSGKSTIANRVLGAACGSAPWPDDRSILDGFPDDLSVKEIAMLLSAVGFASPPAWLRPYRVLSTGQRFRADLARLLAAAQPDTVAVMDEFTSVVDRTVARVGSAALAKAVRARGLKFVAVTCHDDVIDWLQPDWILRADDRTFAWRELQRRPPLHVELVRSTAQAWPLFKDHHYLSDALNASAACFVAFVALPGDAPKPAAFSAWVNQLTLKGGKREHRTVVLPDYQGVGLGMAVSSTIAAMWKGLGHRATSTTTHPAFIAARNRSPLWRMTRAPSLAPGGCRFKHAATRLTAGFEYVGPALPTEDALQLLSA
jgi:ABC-type lipoprotein export system ATPase subunit